MGADVVLMYALNNPDTVQIIILLGPDISGGFKGGYLHDDRKNILQKILDIGIKVLWVNDFSYLDWIYSSKDGIIENKNLKYIGPLEYTPLSVGDPPYGSTRCHNNYNNNCFGSATNINIDIFNEITDFINKNYEE